MKDQGRQRKVEHILLAKDSQVDEFSIDSRFNYEPLFGVHPKRDDKSLKVNFLGKELNIPLWISSMTGGAVNAGKINKNLAQAANEFGLGMGLGSCRPLLNSDHSIKDFDVRKILGDDLPLYANLGIYQVEELIEKKELFKIQDLVERLMVDGLIIHINPLQEWLQMEGDKFVRPPINTVAEFLENVSFPVIVKEVGQGIGPKSLKALMQMPLSAIEFGAFGGTNFSKLELLRRQDEILTDSYEWTQVGHTAGEMVDIINYLVEDLGSKLSCQQYIISGGLKSTLDGHYLRERLIPKSIIGRANRFLGPASDSYELLRKVIQDEVDSLKMAHSYLEIKGKS